MLRLVIVILAFILGFGINDLAGQSETKEPSKDDRYKEMLTLVESGEFAFEARRAFPQSGPSVDLTTHHAVIEFSDSTARARLPYYGRAFHVEYSGPGGIRFEGPVKSSEITRKPERRKILYSFEVRDDDHFRVHMDVGYNGDARVSINSNNRSHISYWGSLSRSATSE
ncbi:MAG: DUF4251 domain-containing protein [Marinilabiliaceae bacterium]